MTAIVANQNGAWNVAGNWTPAQIPITGDDVDALGFDMTLPVDYAAACRSLTSSAGGSVTGAEGSSITIDDTASVDLSVETLVMVGTQAKPCLITSASAPSEPTNKIPAGMTTLTLTWSTIEHMAAVLKASTLTLTDSEYLFYVGTEPEEQDVAGTWSLTRSLIQSYDGERWYVKPSGNDITMVASFLDNCLPSIFSTNFYIILFQMPFQLDKSPRPRVESVTSFLGSTGAYMEVTGYNSEKVNIRGRVSFNDLALWDHVLDHRIFVANLEQLNQDQDEIFAFTWNEGHFPFASLSQLLVQQQPGEAFTTSSRIYAFLVSERPHNT